MNIDKARHAKEIVAELESVQSAINQVAKMQSITSLAKALEPHVRWDEAGKEFFFGLRGQAVAYLEELERGLLKRVESI